MFKTPAIRTVAAAMTLLSLASVATPSFAAPGKDEEAMRVKIEKRDGETFYCFDRSFTGSHIPNQTCRTRDGWAERGVTIKTPEAPEQRSASAARKAAGTS